MPTQARTQARHERILDAALSIFSSRGYRDAAVDDIAQAADTSKGGVYFHFPGKQAIFLALLDRSADLLLSRITGAVESERDPVAKVDAALFALVRLFGEHRSLARLFLVEALGAGPEFRARLARVNQRFTDFIRLNLDDAVQLGAIEPFDTAVASQVWFGALNQVVTEWALAEKPGRLEDTYPALRMLLLRSVGVLPDRLQVLRAARERARQLGRPVLVSATERCPAVEPAELFGCAAALGADRVFWERPDEGLAFVGAGVAWRFESTLPSRFEAASVTWREVIRCGSIDNGSGAAGPTLLGGFSFDPEQGLWPGFPAASLVLPRILLTRRGHDCWLTTSLMVAPDADLEAEEARLAADRALLDRSLLASSPNPQPLVPNPPTDVLPANDWMVIVDAATETIRRGELQKVVLARAVEVGGEGEFDLPDALRGLRVAYPTCALFAFASADGCFIGATPERLVRLRQGVVEVTSLAGTIARGTTPDEDERLGRELLESAKNRQEHAYVVQMLRDRLAPDCEDVEAPTEPTLMKVRNVQHLFTPVRARLRAGRTLIGLVGRLHPSPAVGGVPREPALAWIREHERLDRGWYAGPVGWIDARGEGEYVVAIRSALLHSAAEAPTATYDRATLFAGCGIVADSSPESEYQESVLKLQPMLTALGGLP